MTTQVRNHRLIRLKEVMTLVPLGRSTIYDRIAAGTFPKPKDLGGGVVAWREEDVIAWIDGKPFRGTDNNLGVGEGVADEPQHLKAA